MKKFVLLTLALALCLAGCGGASRPGAMGPMALDEGQQKLLSLLNIQQEVLLFTYESPADCTQMEVWVEIYERGELIESGTTALHQVNDKPRQFAGELVIQLWQEPEFRWTIINAMGEGGSTSGSGSYGKDYDETGRAYNQLEEEVALELGKEVVLYSTVYDMGGGVFAYDPQEYVNRPELAYEQEYVHLIKCKFS